MTDENLHDCPVCMKSFRNVKQHMRVAHPHTNIFENEPTTQGMTASEAASADTTDQMDTVPIQEINNSVSPA